MSLFAKVSAALTPREALAGRPDAIPTAEASFVNGRPLHEPYPEGLELAHFAMGCFWGVERRFWQTDGVWVTAVGYMGGATPNPTYEETCSGRTGHTETVRVVFDPALITYEALLKQFWEGHDPTQGMRQGNDVGSQYRSAIFYMNPEQERVARAYIAQLDGAKAYPRPIVTQVVPFKAFYDAEGYHQDYATKHPDNAYIVINDAPKVANLRKELPNLYTDAVAHP
jgi:peptide-methionine (S)-S-oxide reductase